MAAVGLAMVRELLPSNQPESDAATKLRLELLGEIVAAVGPERFIRAVKDAIKVSRSRWDCSIARVRECAGMRYEPPQSRVAAAWDLVTSLFLNHCRMDAEGRYRLEEKVVLVDGVAEVTLVPDVPPTVLRAVQALGGWGGLAEAHPTYWAAKFNQFKEFFHEDTEGSSSLCVDSRPASSLEKVR